MNIRNYEPGDRQACLDIFDSCTPQYFAPHEKDYLVNWLNAFDEGRPVYDSNDGEYFSVLEVNGEVVGCGGFYMLNSQNKGNMVWGMVHADHHKKGYGSALFRYRQQQIEKLLPGAVVILDTSQHTYGFFEKLGYRVKSVKKDGYGEGLDRYDME